MESLVNIFSGGSSAILGGIVGGILRFIPEVFKLFTLKKDQDHEYRMTQLQLDIDKARATQEIDKIHANEMMETAKSEMLAYIEAVKGQSQMTGIAWVDAVNQTVRPFVTYWFFVLFTIYKVSILLSYSTFDQVVKNIWTSGDAEMLSIILGFWFVDRSFKYLKKSI